MSVRNGEPVTTTAIAEKADGIYVKGGGPSNVKEALWSARVVVATMEALKLVTVKDGKVSNK